MADRERTERLGLTTLDIADVSFGYPERVEFSEVWRENAEILDRIALGATTGAINYYVTSNGSDDAEGTAEAPLLTIQEALDRIPRFVKHPVVITVGTGSFIGGSVSGLFFQADDPATGSFVLVQGTFENAVLASGPSSGTIASSVQGSNNTLAWGYLTASDSPGWTTNDLSGRFIMISSGTGEGQVRAIKSNEDSSLKIVGGWITNPDTSSAFSIVRPATRIYDSEESVTPGDVDTTGTPVASSRRLFNVTRCGHYPEDELGPSNVVFQRFLLSGSSGIVRFFTVSDSTFTLRQCQSETNNIVINAGNSSVYLNENIVSGTMVRSTNVAHQTFFYGTRNYVKDISGVVYTPFGSLSLRAFSRSEMFELSGNTSSVLQGLWGSSNDFDILGTWVSGSTLGSSTAVFKMNSAGSIVGNNFNMRLSSCRVDNLANVVELIGPGNINVVTTIGSGNTNFGAISKGAQLSINSSTTIDSVNGVTVDGSSAISLASLRALSPTVTGSMNFGTRFYQM